MPAGNAWAPPGVTQTPPKGRGVQPLEMRPLGVPCRVLAQLQNQNVFQGESQEKPLFLREARDAGPLRGNGRHAKGPVRGENDCGDLVALHPNTSNTPRLSILSLVVLY